jgi:tetratricopeptide (TPR) repeat protein
MSPTVTLKPSPENRHCFVGGRLLYHGRITFHARRYQLGDNNHDNHEVLDVMVPSLLDEGLYYPDGQILEEVYVYGSYTQSKMYMHNVRCSDCHDMHSLNLHAEGNELCLQCHRGAVYDQPSHQFHKREHEGKPSDGYLCVKCHMPGRTYMGIDYRLDHSLRVPRLDLSLSLGTPNSCSSVGCHDDKELSWVNDAYTRWYGQTRPPHYGEVIAGGRQGAPEAETPLHTLAEDPLVPAIVRATALSQLRQYPGAEITELFSRLLDDDDALIRHTAIRSLENSDRDTRLRLIAPKLYDPVKAVRIEAAVALAGLGDDELREDDRQRFAEVLEDYQQDMRYNGDFAPQHYNLGNLAAALGDDERAVSHYEAALAIDEQFFPARVNLAMLYNRRGDNDQAVAQLRRVVAAHPLQYEAAYSLGLLYAEMGDFEEAAVQLGRAADGMAGYTRVRYNFELALMKLGRWAEAEQALLMVIELEPGNEPYFSTLANLYLGFGMQQRARQLAESFLALHPDHQAAAELFAK